MATGVEAPPEMELSKSMVVLNPGLVSQSTSTHFQMLDSYTFFSSLEFTARGRNIQDSSKQDDWISVSVKVNCLLVKPRI